MHCHTLALMRTLSVEHMVQALFTAGNVLTAMRVLMTVKDTQSPTLLDFHVSDCRKIRHVKAGVVERVEDQVASDVWTLSPARLSELASISVRG